VLVDIPSVSGGEGALADHVEAELRACHGLEVTRIRDNVIARTDLGRGSRVVLAGHTDTVPANANGRARTRGDVVYGLGSADMKGALAVMLRLARDVASNGDGSDDTPDVAVAGRAPALDVTFVFYTGEEISREHSGLLQIEGADPGLLVGDAAILGEPTGGVIEAGCQGVLRLEVLVKGRRAHTARPWTGINAVHRLAPLLARAGGFEERKPWIDGCEYHESLQAVSVHAGVAANVVPDEALLVLSHRFAPDRDASGAEDALREWLSPTLDPGLGDAVRVIDSSPAAPPNLGHPVLRALLDLTGAVPRAKVAWTDVAFFTERGVPALNFGPGDPELAHTADECVTGLQLEGVYSCLRQLIFGAVPTAGA
jgi:succinyl-diaminopimelate desuccinylase